MRFKLLDCVVLKRDLPEHGLRAGDLGTVVEVYEPDGIEMEFVVASGEPRAVVTLSEGGASEVARTDMLAVRETQGRRSASGVPR